MKARSIFAVSLLALTLAGCAAQPSTSSVPAQASADSKAPVGVDFEIRSGSNSMSAGTQVGSPLTIGRLSRSPSHCSFGSDQRVGTVDLDFTSMEGTTITLVPLDVDALAQGINTLISITEQSIDNGKKTAVGTTQNGASSDCAVLTGDFRTQTTRRVQSLAFGRATSITSQDGVEYKITPVLRSLPRKSAPVQSVPELSMRSVDVSGGRITLVDSKRLKDGHIITCQERVSDVNTQPLPDGGEKLSITKTSDCRSQ